MLRKQEENQIKLPSGNTILSNQRLESLSKELFELKEILPFIENNNKNKITGFKQRFTAAKKKIKSAREDAKVIYTVNGYRYIKQDSGYGGLI